MSAFFLLTINTGLTLEAVSLDVLVLPAGDDARPRDAPREQHRPDLAHLPRRRRRRRLGQILQRHR